MRVVRAEEEQHDRDAEQELLGGRVLGSVVDLLPHVQIVVCPSVKFKRHSSNVVEHEVRSSHVRDVRQCPRCLLRHAWHDIVEDLETHDEDEVDCPCPFGVDPVRVSVGECRAVTELLNSLRGLVVDLEDATRPSPTGRVRFRHFVHTPPTRRIGPRVVGDGPLQEDWGRQLAGIVGNCGKLLSCPAGRSDVQFGQREQFVWDVEIERSVDGFAAVGRKGCGYRTGRPGRLRMKLRLAVGFRRWGTRANWLSGLRNDIDLRKMDDSDGREEKLENSRGDGEQQRTECSVVVVKVCTGLA